MHTFNSRAASLAVLSYVAVIGENPLGTRAPAKAIDRHEPYVIYQRQVEMS